MCTVNKGHVLSSCPPPPATTTTPWGATHQHAPAHADLCLTQGDGDTLPPWCHHWVPIPSWVCVLGSLSPQGPAPPPRPLSLPFEVSTAPSSIHVHPPPIAPTTLILGPPHSVSGTGGWFSPPPPAPHEAGAAALALVVIPRLLGECVGGQAIGNHTQGSTTEHFWWPEQESSGQAKPAPPPAHRIAPKVPPLPRRGGR